MPLTPTWSSWPIKTYDLLDTEPSLRTLLSVGRQTSALPRIQRVVDD
jgi:hypothetical protein